MEIITKKIGELKPYKSNPRKNDNAVDAVAASIREFGFKVPIVIDARGEIIAGHTRHKAAKKLGLKEVPCIIADDLTPDQIKAFRLADNKTAELADWDFDLLKSELDDLQFDMLEFGFDVELLEERSESEYEKTQREFYEKMESGELSEDSEEYQEFLAKFEAKKTTDDCYTPPNIYEVVADYVAEHYGVDKSKFVRPFYPNGDYKQEKYASGCVVVDNPPFSIISEICKWYNEHGIQFFLFAPSLTCLGIRSAQKVIINVGIIYENGATIATSFVTNMDAYEFRTAPDLHKKLDEQNRINIKKQHAELPKYVYPNEVINTALLQKLVKHGIEFGVKTNECAFIRKLDAQGDKGIFGSGYLISERAAAERAAAERIAAERAAATYWQLSDREREIIKKLGDGNYGTSE